MPRKAIANGPGITWTVLGDTPRKGLDCIIDLLKERYNPFKTNEKFLLQIHGSIPEIRENSRVELDVFNKDDNGPYEEYGNVALTYARPTVDKTTSEHKTAQLFWVYFNMGDKSYQERDYFLKQK